MSDVNRSLAESRDAFERACRACGARLGHRMFGTISTADYARFQTLHTLHHTKQITGQKRARSR